MSIFPHTPCASHVSFDQNNMCVDLSDGRKIFIPLVYFNRLLNATESQRNHYVISGGGTGLHWEEIDEDIRVDNLLLGIFDQTFPKSSVA